MKAPCDWHDVYLDKLGSQQESEFMPDGSNKEILIKGLLAEVWAAWGNKQGIVSPRETNNNWKGQKGKVESAESCSPRLHYGHCLWPLGTWWWGSRTDMPQSETGPLLKPKTQTYHSAYSLSSFSASLSCLSYPWSLVTLSHQHAQLYRRLSVAFCAQILSPGPSQFFTFFNVWTELLTSAGENPSI